MNEMRKFIEEELAKVEAEHAKAVRLMRAWSKGGETTKVLAENWAAKVADIEAVIDEWRAQLAELPTEQPV